MNLLVQMGILVTLNLTGLWGSEQHSSFTWFILSSFGSSLVREMRYGIKELSA